MASKLAFLLLAVFALSLLSSSEVTARDLPNSNHAEVETKNHGEVDDAKYGYGGYPGRGRYGGSYPGRGSYGVGRRGGYCRYGCCGGGYYGGGCRRCCSYASEAVNAQTKTEPQN